MDEDRRHDEDERHVVSIEPETEELGDHGHLRVLAESCGRVSGHKNTPLYFPRYCSREVAADFGPAKALLIATFRHSPFP
jgi:hypothetical protein